MSVWNVWHTIILLGTSKWDIIRRILFLKVIHEYSSLAAAIHNNMRNAAGNSEKVVQRCSEVFVSVPVSDHRLQMRKMLSNCLFFQICNMSLQCGHICPAVCHDNVLVKNQVEFRLWRRCHCGSTFRGDGCWSQSLTSSSPPASPTSNFHRQ